MQKKKIETKKNKGIWHTICEAIKLLCRVVKIVVKTLFKLFWLVWKIVIAIIPFLPVMLLTEMVAECSALYLYSKACYGGQVPEVVHLEMFIVLLVVSGVLSVVYFNAENTRKKIEAMKECSINNKNWEHKFRQYMLDKVDCFKKRNVLTTAEQIKFLQIVNYSIRELREKINDKS